MKMKKFYSFSSGSCFNADKKFEKLLLRKRRLKKVTKTDKCHFYLVFCPIVSRVKTDITSAMEAVPGDKPVILVVLHHTFDKNYSVPSSNGLATAAKPGQVVILAVNCLFHETKGLLDCSQNDNAIREVLRKKREMKEKPNHSDGAARALQATGELAGQKDPAESKGGTKDTKMKKFYSFSPDSSLSAARKFEKRLGKKGLKKVTKTKKCHFYLVFCPIVSRVKTDVTSAMEAIPGDKKVILVVLHHTFDKNYSVPSSSGLASAAKPGQVVVLTVNCLFHETKGLLDCSQNDDAIREIHHVHINGKKKSWNFFRLKK